MFITALCPTFRRPKLIANTLALWAAQDYPLELRRLVILDDGGTYRPQVLRELNADIYSIDRRLPTLAAKYNALWKRLAPKHSDAFAIWEDDDLYLPGYLSGHARALERGELSKPAYILTDYPGYLRREPAAGRIHSSMAFRRELIERVGGWPDTPEMSFDLQLIARLHAAAEVVDPWLNEPGEYIYGWHTGHHHGQSAGDATNWYERYGELHPPIVPRVEQVSPAMDDRTARLLTAHKKGRQVGQEPIGR